MKIIQCLFLSLSVFLLLVFKSSSCQHHWYTSETCTAVTLTEICTNVSSTMMTQNKTAKVNKMKN